MRFRAATAALLVVILALTTAVGGVIADDPTDDETLAEPNVAFDVYIDDGGDAQWTVTASFPLADDEEVTAFQQIGSEYREGTADVGYSVDWFERAADRTQDTVDREMTVDNETRSYAIEEDGNASVGTMQLSFTWTAFAEVDDDVRVGDAFVDDDGPWLGSLAENQTLRVHAPEGYSVVQSQTRVHNATTLVWTGPYRFTAGDFTAQFSRINTGNGDDEVNGNGEETALADFARYGAGLLVVLVAVGYLLRRTTVGPEIPSEPGTVSGTDEGSSDSGEDPSRSADRHGDEGTDAVSSEGVERSEEPPEPTPENPFAGVDEELLSDEERVELLLEAHGGRMKQALIVEETGWSNAKVSQLLSTMDDEERIDKIRIGRENLIALPDEELGEIGS